MAAEKNPIINDAIDVVKFFSADEMARHNALREQVAMIDEVHRMRDSRVKGIEQRNEEIAQKMLKRGMEISSIIEITGLSEKQVVDISKSMNV